MDIKDYHIRNFLRVLTAIVLVAYAYFVIADRATNGKVYLDSTDFAVIGFCVAILLGIEAVKAYVKNRLNKK